MSPYNGTYKNDSKEAYKVSRSKIDSFLNCPRCFYLDRVMGIGQPPGFPFNLNSAVDHLLKKEFDIHRVKGTAHPLMDLYGIDAIPYSHADMDKWRANFTGVQALHKPTNLLVFGAVDDVWVNPKGELIVVDYKATSKDGEVTLDADWQIGYKRQMEVYQWLLRQNGFKVSDTGYFVYCNGDKSAPAFDGKLEFNIKVIPYTGDDKWIEATLKDLKKCLNSNEIPDYSDNCDYCKYQQKLKEIEAGPISGEAEVDDGESITTGVNGCFFILQYCGHRGGFYSKKQCVYENGIMKTIVIDERAKSGLGKKNVKWTEKKLRQGTMDKIKTFIDTDLKVEEEKGEESECWDDCGEINYLRNGEPKHTFNCDLFDKAYEIINGKGR